MRESVAPFYRQAKQLERTQSVYHARSHVLPGLGDEPSLTADQAMGSAAPGTSSPARLPRVMLVDDDACMLEVQVRMLRSLGYGQVSTAASGKEALLQLDHDPRSAEVIVCDLAMPDMDGIEFLQTLNSSSFRGSVILLSGESLRIMNSVRRLLGGGHLTILGALMKPANRAAMLELLQCWLPVTQPLQNPPHVAVTTAELFDANRLRQWVLHYQPQVNLTTGALVGMEALVRWNHPAYGLIFPDQFIALAEDCGAIDGLTDWVVQQALAQRATWQTQGLHVQIAINLSIESLRAPDLWKRLTALVRSAGAAPQDVALEVTESRIVSSSAISLENLLRLRLAGFTLSIDDFGTGHSSLAQLRDVPFNELKIDRGFVGGARKNQIIRPMLEGSLGIAKRMGMKSVAEGVETRDDWDLLRELDCDIAQGYFIGKPMGVERIWDWLCEWQGRLPSLGSS